MLNQLPAELIFLALFIVLVFFFLLSVVIVVIHTMRFSTKLLAHIEKDKNADADKIKEDAYNQAAKIVEEAKIASLAILKDSNIKSQEILKAATSLTDDTHAKIAKANEDMLQKHTAILESTSQDLLSQYSSVLNSEQAKDLEGIHSISDTLEKQLASEMSVFREALLKELEEGRKGIQDNFKEQYNVIDDELTKYKEAKLKKIDESLFKILELVSVEAIGKTMSFEDNVSFIEKYLQDIKKSINT